MAIHVTHKSKRSLTVSAGAGFSVSSNGTTVGRRYMLSFVNYDGLGNIVSAVSPGEGVTWTLLTSKVVAAGSFSFFHGTCTSAGTGMWRASAGVSDVIDCVLDEIEGGISAQSIANIIDLSAAIGSAANPQGNTQVIELGPLTNSESGTYEIWWNKDVFAFPYSISARSPTVTAMGHWVTSGGGNTSHILTTFTSAASSASVQVSAQTGGQLFRGFGFEIIGQTTINVQSSEYGYEVDSVDIVQQHAISPASSEYGFDILSVSIFGAVIVVPSDYGYESGSPSLVQQHIIAPASSEYGYESQSAEVLRNIAVQSLEMGYEIGSVEFVRNLIVQSSEYGIEIESVDLVQQHAISPGSSEYGYETGSLSLVQQQEISPGSSEYGVDIGTVNFAIIYTLGVESAEFGYETKSVLLRMFRPGGSLGRRIVVPQDKRRILI